MRFKFFLLLSICCFSIQAQNKKIVAGVDFSAFSYSYANFKPGFYFGFNYDISRLLKEKELYIQSGLLFTSGGSENDPIFGITKFTVNTYSLEIPINFSYRFPIKEKSKIVLDAGPYLRYGLFGSREVVSDTENSNINPFNIYRRFDAGFNTGVGIEYRQLYFQLSCQHGIINVEKSGGTGKTLKLRLGIGYTF